MATENIKIFITRRQLISLGACEDEVREFKYRFGESVEVTESEALKAADVFDWDWLANHTLTVSALAEYRRVTVSAWAEYWRVIAPAWARLYIEQEAGKLASAEPSNPNIDGMSLYSPSPCGE